MAARARHVRIVGATIAPFEGALPGTPFAGLYATPDKEAIRQQVNRWIRSSGAFDAVADFDAVLRDPAHPARLATRFDSGDHLHPGDAGYAAMARALSEEMLFGVETVETPMGAALKVATPTNQTARICARQPKNSRWC